MTNPTRIEVCCDKDCPNFGIQQEIELTDAEIAQLAIDQAAAQARKAEEDAAAAETAAHKASADAKLTAFYESIGLTPEEIAAKL